MSRAKRAPAEIELDLGRYELRRLGHRVKLEKKPMELLIFLVSRRDQLVSRTDIVARLWRSDLFVDTDRNINNIVRKIRTALRDDSSKPRFLETVVGKGYRFVGPVRVIDVRYARSDFGQSAGTAIREDLAGWNERSSLAVLPLVFLGNATDDHGLGLGFADALVSRLGNLQGVDVLPTSAVLNVPAEAAASDTASRLGVRFIVRGAVQVSKGQLRLGVEMFDAQVQAACFTRARDLDLNSLSEVEDEIAKQIAGALKRPLRPATEPRRRRYSKDPLAYAEFMRGYRLSSSGDAALLGDADRHLSSAVTRDPDFSLAHAVLSFVCATRHFEFDPASLWLEKAEFHCRRARIGSGFARSARGQSLPAVGAVEKLSASGSDSRTQTRAGVAEQSAARLQPARHHPGSRRVARPRARDV